MAANQDDDGIAAGRRYKTGVCRQFIGGGLGEVSIEAEHFLSCTQRVGHYSSHDRRADGVELILEGSHDAEITATAAQSPKQVRILSAAGGQQAAISGDYIRRKKVVDRQAVFAGEPT